ncbi:FAD-dependent monooxygenase [Nocardia sp. NPDC050408]|uniref:FAD-dependent monooxygenase n=1 Tax=Nocardia sp. NPDC050408 TaxID=3364319 RepID=UPI0037B25D5D
MAVVGAGIGGLALAHALASRGFSVQVYEQAHQLARLGAGIQQSPNAVKVLRELGLEPALRARGFQPSSFIHRDARSGEITNNIRLGAGAEAKYGAPYLLLHRGDLHQALLESLPRGTVTLGRRLVGLDDRGDRVDLTFEGRATAQAEIVVGADGVHSTVRQALFGDAQLRYSGRVGYRATVPAERLNGTTIDDNTKWWGPDRHLIAYYVTRTRDELYVMGTIPEPDFALESWSASADVRQFRAAFEAFHPTVQTMLNAVDTAHKWALADRTPMASWSRGNVVLIGDAVHPMMPHMGQGAAMALEDVAILTRCLDETDADWVQAFDRYRAARHRRASEMQMISAGNTFARSDKDTVDWLYAYDAWLDPLPTTSPNGSSTSSGAA